MAEVIETTSMSTKGQVVIPEDIRKSMHLKPGTKFIVMGSDNTVMLKKIGKFGFEKFDEMAKKAGENALVKKLARLPEEERTKEIQKLIDRHREARR
ncbi:MAG TPA: AbrB/MazE/SpoVT family DNA-binding domain-containing protein [archaeon]|nr:AbrB/MazE/SpoVT family DNA-binding domain-containing protein [archaeon]